jgi:hypothetical protein
VTGTSKNLTEKHFAGSQEESGPIASDSQLVDGLSYSWTSSAYA